MKTPLVIVLIIVAGMLGFLTIYSQQHEMGASVQKQESAAAVAGGNVSAAPAATSVPGGK